MHTNTRSPLFITSLVFTLAAFALTTAHVSACDCGKSAQTSGSTPRVTSLTTPSANSSTSPEPGQKPSATPRKFPLKGVVTDRLPDRSALMVKHEAIPGVMKAMTMLFTVDASVLSTVKKGDAITALMSRRGDDWHLDEVKVIPPAS